MVVFFFKQNTAYEMRISDWSSDVCSSDLALVDEQAGELDRLVERAAAVAAQVHHHAVDVLAAELLEQPGHVARRRGVVVAVLPAALEVLVEGRQLDHAYAARGRAVLRRQGEDLGLGGPLREPDLGAGKQDAGGLGIQERKST